MTLMPSDFVSANKEKYTAIRRFFHQIPEPGWEEYLTTWHIYQHLKKLDVPFTFTIGKDLLNSDSRLGLPSEQVLLAAYRRLEQAEADTGFIEKIAGGHTGLMVTLESGRPGPNSLFRFDIDGLPVREADSERHIPVKAGFQSTHPGYMHACGHDGHITTGLALAEFIALNQDSLNGRIQLLFQPAEEGGRGAKAVADRGWMKDVDYFVSGHIGISQYPVGTVSARTCDMLATSKLDIRFSGRSSHAANNPQEGRNALLAAASCVLGLHGISRHSDGGSRINVGTLNAGSGRNIIADKAEMMVELRGENDEINAFMLDQAKKVTEGSALMHGVEHELLLVGHALAASCDEPLAERIENVLKSSPVVTDVVHQLPLKASEDASVLMDAVQKSGGQATYLMFCSPTCGGHHNPEFDFDESVLSITMDVMARSLLALNGS